MEGSQLEEFLKRKIREGDIVLIEYPSRYPLEKLVWGKIIPELSHGNQIIIDDFFGIGDLTFRNYIRTVPPKEYKELIEIAKSLKVIKIGPGMGSYGTIIDEIPLTYEVPEFMKNYYDAIRKASSSAIKPVYFITFGLAEYLYFGKEKGLQVILFSRSNLPVEDWTSIYFINKDVIQNEVLAILEEISPWVIDVVEKENEYKIEIKKGLFDFKQR